MSDVTLNMLSGSEGEEDEETRLGHVQEFVNELYCDLMNKRQRGDGGLHKDDLYDGMFQTGRLSYWAMRHDHQIASMMKENQLFPTIQINGKEDIGIIEVYDAGSVERTIDTIWQWMKDANKKLINDNESC